MSEFTKPCLYCGTLLNDDEQEASNVAAYGPRMTHYASVCRERVHAALRYECSQLATTTRELAAAKATIRKLRENCPHRYDCDGVCMYCEQSNGGGNG